MIERDVADHQHAAQPVGERDELGALAVEGERLLDEHVVAGEEGRARELVVRRRRRCDHHRLDRGIVENRLEGRRAERGRDRSIAAGSGS